MSKKVENKVNNQVPENNEVPAIEENKESKIKGIASKVGNGVKKHGKKIAVGAAIAVAGVVTGIVLKNRAGSNSYLGDEGEGLDTYDYDVDLSDIGESIEL